MNATDRINYVNIGLMAVAAIVAFLLPFEAFLSEKPVVTTLDAGGPLEIVHDRETGVVVAPDAAELARGAAYLTGHVAEAKAWGRAGKAIAERVTWDACVDALLS